MPQKVNAPVECNLCGQKWPRDPAYEVPCPICRAPAGKPCMRPSEHVAWSIHPERDRAAMDAGLLQKCPKGRSAEQGELSLKGDRS